MQLLRMFVVGTLICGAAQAAQACDACAGGYAGGYFGYNLNTLYRDLDNKIPYYAAYPPVYYSAPVPRTYGYSPFAYPPGVRTPEVVVEPVQPQTIINPHVEESSYQQEAEEAAEPTASNTAPMPVVIYNPYASPSVSVVSQVGR